MKKKVSIIVPVYNVEKKYLIRCLESLKGQTLEDIEIIIVNDGSTDDSGEFCKKFIEENNLENKFFYFQKRNGGLSDARNYAIKYISGEYVAFLDSDDYVELNIYEKMYSAAKLKNAKIIECEFFYEFKNYQKIEKLPTKYTTINEYICKSSVVAWNKLINSEWLKGQDTYFVKGMLFEDLNFFFKLCSSLDSINDVYTINEALIHYVQRENSITNSNYRNIEMIVDTYCKTIEELKNLNKFEIIHSEIEYKMARNLLCAFFKKVLNIKNRMERVRIVEYYWKSLITEFPNWKKNKYIRYNSLTNIYLKLINLFFIKIICLLK